MIKPLAHDRRSTSYALAGAWWWRSLPEREAAV